MYKVQSEERNGWRSIVLSDEEYGLSVEIIPSAGAMMNDLVLRHENGDLHLVEGYSGKEDFMQNVHKGFRSAKLSPFVCRLNRAEYTWDGKNYRLDKFMLGDSSIHGLLYDASFDVVETRQDSQGCSVTMRYQYDKGHPGYPFSYNCTVKYDLSAGGTLAISTHLSCPSSEPATIPVCDGWHPYFRLGGKVDEWWLEVASDQMMEYDGDLIPTGRFIESRSFFPGKTIGNTMLDNGFLVREGRSPVCTLRNEKAEINIVKATNYPYLQLYIPEHRNSIAIENLSAAPDAFNNGMGLTVLEPGKKVDFETVIRFRQVRT